MVTVNSSVQNTEERKVIELHLTCAPKCIAAMKGIWNKSFEVYSQRRITNWWQTSEMDLSKPLSDAWCRNSTFCISCWKLANIKHSPHLLLSFLSVDIRYSFLHIMMVLGSSKGYSWLTMALTSEVQIHDDNLICILQLPGLYANCSSRQGHQWWSRPYRTGSGTHLSHKASVTRNQCQCHPLLRPVPECLYNRPLLQLAARPVISLDTYCLFGEYLFSTSLLSIYDTDRTSIVHRHCCRVVTDERCGLQ